MYDRGQEVIKCWRVIECVYMDLDLGFVVQEDLPEKVACEWDMEDREGSATKSEEDYFKYRDQLVQRP